MASVFVYSCQEATESQFPVLHEQQIRKLHDGINSTNASTASSKLGLSKSQHYGVFFNKNKCLCPLDMTGIQIVFCLILSIYFIIDQLFVALTSDSKYVLNEFEPSEFSM